MRLGDGAGGADNHRAVPTGPKGARVDVQPEGGQLDCRAGVKRLPRVQCDRSGDSAWIAARQCGLKCSGIDRAEGRLGRRRRPLRRRAAVASHDDEDQDAQ